MYDWCCTVEADLFPAAIEMGLMDIRHCRILRPCIRSSNPQPSSGLRKVRWGRAGSGKRGGVRAIYYNRLANGEIWLLLVYGKSVRDNIPAHVLRQIKEEIEDA